MANEGATGKASTKQAWNDSGTDIVRGVAITITGKKMTLATSGGTPPNVLPYGITTEDVPTGKLGAYAYADGDVVRFLAGGTVAFGDLLMPTTGGKFIKVTDGNGYMLRSENRTALASGELGVGRISFGTYDVT